MFKIPHQASAATATTHEAPIQHRFLKDTAVREFCSLASSNLPAPSGNECNEFTADKGIGRTKTKLDITGVHFLDYHIQYLDCLTMRQPSWYPLVLILHMAISHLQVTCSPL